MRVYDTNIRFRHPDHNPNLVKGNYKLKSKGADSFVEAGSNDKLTADLAKARVYPSDYLMGTCWDWMLYFEAVKI